MGLRFGGWAELSNLASGVSILYYKYVGEPDLRSLRRQARNDSSDYYSRDHNHQQGTQLQNYPAQDHDSNLSPKP